MIRVFLEANVLFPASTDGSNIACLVHRLIEQEEVITSDSAAEEARRNVQLKRQTWAMDLEALIGQVQVVPSIQFDLPLELSAKDRPILCAAIRSECQHLATGDRKDFGHLSDHIVEDVTIMTLAKLAGVVVQKPRRQ